MSVRRRVVTTVAVPAAINVEVLVVATVRSAVAGVTTVVVA
ncbi:hypothetical protein [Kribbella qitaiheensis]|nr:hypothetical protein [Kribbella qitaiheensis]